MMYSRIILVAAKLREARLGRQGGLGTEREEQTKRRRETSGAYVCGRQVACRQPRAGIALPVHVPNPYLTIGTCLPCRPVDNLTSTPHDSSPPWPFRLKCASARGSLPSCRNDTSRPFVLLILSSPLAHHLCAASDLSIPPPAPRLPSILLAPSESSHGQHQKPISTRPFLWVPPSLSPTPLSRPTFHPLSDLLPPQSHPPNHLCPIPKDLQTSKTSKRAKRVLAISTRPSDTAAAAVDASG
ncbi:hypothetical protein HDK90DRAFT_228769 [Phyllosticta capitalensis]|uniref:Uncharacterized protein n=1 Tax=Phyllosticta capitalensis TaxID=121624 RepID=A0ABR1YU91_9PEZI